MVTANVLMTLWSCLAKGCSSLRNELLLHSWVFSLALSVLLMKVPKHLHHHRGRRNFSEANHHSKKVCKLREVGKLSRDLLYCSGVSCLRVSLRPCLKPVSMRAAQGRFCPCRPFFLPASCGLHKQFSHKLSLGWWLSQKLSFHLGLLSP